MPSPTSAIRSRLGQLRHQRPPRHVAATAPSPRRTSWRSPRRSASTAAGQGIDRPALHGQGHARRCPAPAQRTALEVLAANGVETSSSSDDGVTPTPVISHAILALQPRPQRPAWPTASSSRRRTTRPRTAASSTTRPTAAPPTPTSPTWIQDRANALLRDGNRGRQAPAVRRGRSRRRRRTRTTSSRPTSSDLGNVIDMDAIRARRPQARRRSARRRGGRTTGSRSANVYGLDIDRRQPGRRSDVRVHDRRSRRQDPHGLLQPVRDGRAGRPEGPLPRRVRQRPRRRPARHRHAVGRPDEPQPLPGRRHPLPADAPPALAGAGGGRQDAGQQQHDRPRRRPAWAGGWPEVPVGFKWFAAGLFDGSFCFGGEESAGASFLRRDGTVWTTDKDGLIMGLLAAEITARTGQGPGRALPRADGAVRDAVLHADRRAGDAGAEGGC